MTMHADQLVGAQVTDSDGLEVGTVEQVFRDDVDGTPSWARIRSGKGFRFVPLAGSKTTRGGGIWVPFDSRKILGEPHISVDRHMSIDQEEQLRRYFGIRVPAQRTRTLAPAEEPAGAWVIRSEERIAVSLETRESGRVTVRKYVDSEPVRQTIRVFHEELEIERIPIGDGEPIAGDLVEFEQEVILHEARAKITKETVPVERVRLSVRKVEEDETVTGEVRKERIEVIDDDPASPSPPEP